jgi:hypothetical protein
MQDHSHFSSTYLNPSISRTSQSIESSSLRSMMPLKVTNNQISKNEALQNHLVSFDNCTFNQLDMKGLNSFN